ncbi:cytochrome P450 4C1-like isoform X2 [Camponotus floridanus]|nr:cytochrome P450 4C1-like isoform X2 [Camponotus floridanus]
MNEYYPFFKFGGFFVYGVCISHPDDLETILSSTKYIEKGRLYNLLHPWLNTGLLTSKGVKWQTRRKILTPTFHFNILNQFVDIFIKEGDCMTKSLKNVEISVVKDLSSFISEHTLNAICETAMGVSLQKLGEFQKQYRNAINEIVELMIYRAVKPWFYNDMLFSLNATRKKAKESLENIAWIYGKNYCGKKALSPTY